jgi:hypothetical protein
MQIKHAMLLVSKEVNRVIYREVIIVQEIKNM